MQNHKFKGLLRSPSVHVWADVSPLPAFKIETEAGARARVGAVHVSDEWLDCVPISVALASRAMPAGPLLLECQGQQVLTMAQRQAGKLQASTAKDGRAMSDTSVSEAVGAGAAAVVAWGRWSAPEEMAHELYAGLRALDGAGCTVILCPLPPAEGIGAAIRDRLIKAGSSG